MPTANSLAERFVPGGAGAREAIVQWVEALSAESIRERLLNHPLGGLNGPSFFDGTCLDPIITQEDCGFFEPWAKGMALQDGDIIAFRWGGVWRLLAQSVYGTDLGIKLVRFVDSEPWLACNEVPMPLAGQEILGVLRAIRPKRAVLEDLDAALLRAIETMSSGTMLMLAAVDMSMSGLISGSGPADPKEREALLRSGWQPYSVKMGDRWYAYNRMDPIGSTLGLAAGFAESAINSDWESIDPADFEEAFVGAVASVAGNMMSKTYLTGISDFFEAMSDPRRYAEGYARRLAGSLVPAGVGEVARQVDPHMRDANTMLDAIKRRIPGLSDELPLARDVFGRPISYQSGLGLLYDIFSPIYSKREAPEPIDREIIDQGFVISKPDKDFKGVDLGRHPHAYSRFLELSGNALKHPSWGLGAKDLLNEIVSGKHLLSQAYDIRSDGPDGEKERYLRDIMGQYREMAKRQLLEEFPDLKREVDLIEARKRELRMPVFQPRVPSLEE